MSTYAVVWSSEGSRYAGKLESFSDRFELSGRAVVYVGNGALSKPGAVVHVTFTKPGRYVFGTKPGEDYMKGVKTIGEDNVLKLVVTVS
jgi:hypothetical protein